MTKLQQLEAILTKMRRFSGADPEKDHHYADDLLVEALEVLSTPATKEIVDEIVTAWTDTEKWYA